MWRLIRKIAIVTIVVIALLAVAAWITWSTVGKIHHSKPKVTPAAIIPSGDAVLDSIRRGIEFVKVYQEDDGQFSCGLVDPKPAFTAMVVEAILSSPEAPSLKDNPWLQKAVDAILACQQENGGIYTPRIPIGNYCTCVSIMALAAANEELYRPQIKRATAYLLGIQWNDQAKPDDSGGFGYSSGSRPDLSNTVMAIEALRSAGLAADDPAIQNAVKFVSKCQNCSETNPLNWALDDGGFIYKPASSDSTERDKQAKGRGFKSYGTMTYAGLLSMVYANIGPDDMRVKSAMAWIDGNYSVHENVAMGNAGLFYYYRMMSKALSTASVKTLKTATGDKDWAQEMAAAIIEKQQPDGSWVNTNAAWMESDPILVTAYCVRALSFCRGVITGAK
ncbi:MAG: prenyltransferase/squalene oxidase repeat-containing protein [Candidatus Brocadiia bacterium]